MSRKLKKLTSVCLALIMILGVMTVAPVTAGAAEETGESVSETSGDFEYELYDEITITGYTGSATNLTIPSEIDGYTVSEIGSFAFESCTSLKSVTIPDSIEAIGDFSFANTSLSGVTISPAVTYIGEYAFGYMVDEEEWVYSAVDGFTITGFTNSRAELYADNNGFKFVSIGETEPYAYDLNYDDTASIICYNGKESDLIIPSEIDGYTVNDIGFSAFAGNNNLKSVTIPDSITEIGSYAFSGCSNLESVTIPDSVTDIYSYAFYECESLASITIPDSVKYIEEYAFADTALSSVTIPSDTSSIGERAFGYVFDYDLFDYVKADGFKISGYTNSAAYSYAYENGFDFVSLGKIEPFVYVMFGENEIAITDYNGSETNLTVPSAIDGYPVTCIDSYAFENCISLESVQIPDSVISIGDGAFENCSNLLSITIPASVEHMGECAVGYIFDREEWISKPIDGITIYGYTNSEADIYAEENGFNFVSIGETDPYIYEVDPEDNTVIINDYNGRETNLTIPSEFDGYTVTQIGFGAFEDRTCIESVTIPDSIKYIDDYAFASTSLTEITVPKSVTYIGDYAFGYTYDKDECDYNAVDGFTIYGYTNSDSDMYAYENGFKFVSLGEVNPYEYQVYNNTAVITDYNGKETNLTIPSEIGGYRVTQIDSGAFQGLEKLESATIPDGVTSIGYWAFGECTNLENITIPDSVEYIADHAFYATKWYDNLPNGLIYIGKVAYEYRGEMPEKTTVELKDGTTGIAGCAFAEYENLVEIIIPDSMKVIGDLAFAGCTGLESVEIPNGVTDINAFAFAGCTSLKSVNIPDGVTIISYGTFSECTSLESVTIPDSVTEIESFAFLGCKSLKSLTIPYTVKNIDGFASIGYCNDEFYEEYIKVDGFKIYGYTGSAAERYANENGFEFVSLGTDPTAKLGDVNGDGKISIDDATEIQKYLANMLDFTSEQKELADVDNNGSISIDDVTLVQKYLAGLAEM